MPEVASPTAPVDNSQPAEQPEERPSVDLSRHLAGTFGDPVTSVENLPGVRRSTSDGDGVVIWGARVDDSRVLVDGIEVPALLHVGSQRSVIGLDAPGPVELVHGAYGAGYGRALGGLILISTRDVPAVGVHGAAQANLADASLMLSGAPTSRFRAGLSGTWSYADHTPDAFGAPVTTFYGPARYRDLQAKAELDLAPQRRLTALVLGATEGAQPSYATLRYPPHERTWYRVALRYTDDRKSHVLVMPFVGWTNDDLNRVAPAYYLPVERHLHTFHYGLRAERQFWLADRAVLTASLDGSFERTQASQVGSPYFPVRPEDPNVLNPPGGSNLAPSDWQATVGDVAASLSLRWQVGRWTLSPAFRADVFPTFVESGWSAFHVSIRGFPVALGPRLSVEYLPHPSVSLHAAAGLYSQPASAGDLSSIFGNPWLGPARSAQGRAGVRWRVTASTSVEATGFLRQSWDIAVRGSMENADDPRLVSDGRARAYGAEVMLLKEVTARLDAWLAYTISRSEMRDSPRDPWTLAPQDRLHALTALFVHRWRGWLSSARFRYASGPPFTPVDNAVMNSSTDFYSPIYGPRNSARLGAFMQADLRLGREFRLGPGVGSISFDITNVTSRENNESVVAYSYNYSRYATIGGPSRTYMLGACWQW
jgi:hypothetical protein